MGKKNIQPNSSQPVFRSLVARPALEELREENLTEGQGQAGQWGIQAAIGSVCVCGCSCICSCSYDGDDE
mgnify:CR=1 FL=1